MRRLFPTVFAVLGVVAAVGISSGANAGRAWLGDRAPKLPANGVSVAPTKPLLALIALPNTAVILQRVDPISLERLSTPVAVGEYHDAWSVAPDRTQLALAVSTPGRKSRIGILIVDVRSMQVVRSVETGIAAEALGWLAPRRLVAALQRGGTVLADPLTGKLLRRWPGFSFLDTAGRAPNGFVILFGGAPKIRYEGSTGTWQGTVIPHLGLADARGRFRSMPLERIRLGVRSSGAYTDKPGLAVDPSRARAYVFTADAPVASVDLRTMRVSYHRLANSPTHVRTKNVLARDRHALWLGDGQIAVFGHDLLRPAGRERSPSIPAGATLVDTATWKTRLLDPTADNALFAGGMLLTYRSNGATPDGLRLYTVRGRRVQSLLEGEHVEDVHLAGAWAYIRTQHALYVLDVTSKRIVNKIVPPAELVDAIGS